MLLVGFATVQLRARGCPSRQAGPRAAWSSVHAQRLGAPERLATMDGKENRTLSREAKAEGRVDAKPPKKPGGFSFAKLGQKRRENLVAQGLVPADVPVETFIRAGGAVEKRVVQPPPSPEPAALLRARAALAADGAANVRNADVRKEAARQRLRRTQSLRVVCRVLNACATRLMSRQLERGFRSLYVLFLNRRAVFTRAALDAAHATGRESEARAAAAQDKALKAEARALTAEEAKAESERREGEAVKRLQAAEEAQKGADERAAAAEAKTHEAEARLLEALRTATEANERCAAAERRAAAAEGRARVAQQLADAAEAKAPSRETATSPIPEVRASLRQSLAELRGEASSVKGRKTPPSRKKTPPSRRKASPAPKKPTPKLATEARAPEVAPAAPPAAPPTTPHARPPPELRDDLAAQYRALLASNGCPAPAPRDATADELWGLLDQERRRDGGAPLSPPAPPVARGAPASRTPPTSPYAEQQKSPYDSSPSPRREKKRSPRRRHRSRSPEDASREIDDVLASIRDDKRLTAIRAALAAAKRDIARSNEQTKTETALDDQQKELEDVRREAQAVAAERKTREEDLEKRVERELKRVERERARLKRLKKHQQRNAFGTIGYEDGPGSPPPSPRPARRVPARPRSASQNRARSSERGSFHAARKIFSGASARVAPARAKRPKSAPLGGRRAASGEVRQPRWN